MSSVDFLLQQNLELREQRAALNEENARLLAALKECVAEHGLPKQVWLDLIAEVERQTPTQRVEKP